MLKAEVGQTTWMPTLRQLSLIMLRAEKVATLPHWHSAFKPHASVTWTGKDGAELSERSHSRVPGVFDYGYTTALLIDLMSSIYIAPNGLHAHATYR